MSTPRENIRILEMLKEEYEHHVQEVTEFILESAQKRADAIQMGEIHLITKAISAEVALASGLERIDIVQFLIERLHLMSQLEAEIQATESEVYQNTFDKKGEL